MTISMIATYVVKPEKMGEYMSYTKKCEAWIKSRQDLFKEAKSIKLFSHVTGSFGGFVEMWEFESLSEMEKWIVKYMKDKDYATYHTEFMALIVPETYSINIWTSVGELR